MGSVDLDVQHACTSRVSCTNGGGLCVVYARCACATRVPLRPAAGLRVVCAGRARLASCLALSCFSAGRAREPSGHSFLNLTKWTGGDGTYMVLLSKASRCGDK
jgi:hypothetical protein